MDWSPVVVKAVSPGDTAAYLSVVLNDFLSGVAGCGGQLSSSEGPGPVGLPL